MGARRSQSSPPSGGMSCQPSGDGSYCWLATSGDLKSIYEAITAFRVETTAIKDQMSKMDDRLTDAVSDLKSEITGRISKMEQQLDADIVSLKVTQEQHTEQIKHLAESVSGMEDLLYGKDNMGVKTIVDIAKITIGVATAVITYMIGNWIVRS